MPDEAIMTKEVPYFDVICVGGGGAGVTAAVVASQHGAHVALLSKEPIGYGTTRLALGAMATVGLVSGDSPLLLFKEIMEEGQYFNHKGLAMVLAQGAAESVTTLESFGHMFKRDTYGSPIAFRMGKHRFERTLVSPGEGISIGQALRAACARSGVEVFEETAATKLLVEGGQIKGVVCYDLATGNVFVLGTDHVILATGGAGWLYFPHTDVAKSVTGDGYALALAAGCELVDMEQVIITPFAVSPRSSAYGFHCGIPVTEVLGGLLKDKEGNIIIEDFRRMSQAELSMMMQKMIRNGRGTKEGCLLLDLSLTVKTEEGKKLHQVLKEGGFLEIIRFAQGQKAYEWQVPIEVSPTVHYNIGGIRVDENLSTPVIGLYAAGEVQGGIHGLSRLSSLALTDLFVFGKKVGEATGKRRKNQLSGTIWDKAQEEAGRIRSFVGMNGHHRPICLMQRLQKVMWEEVGAFRNRAGLLKAIAVTDEIEEMSKDLKISNSRTYNQKVLDAIELGFMIKAARSIVFSSLAREESRGSHVRTDFLGKSDRLPNGSVVSWEENGKIRTRMEDNSTWKAQPRA